METAEYHNNDECRWLWILDDGFNFKEIIQRSYEKSQWNLMINQPSLKFNRATVIPCISNIKFISILQLAKDRWKLKLLL